MSEPNGRALATTSSPAAAPLATDLALDAERLALLARTIGAELRPDELQLFLAVAARTGLDPFARQIYAIKNRQGFFVHIGIDGRRAIAQRTGLVDGMLGPFWCGPDGQWRDVWLEPEPPLAARVGVLKRGCREPFWGTAHLRSFRGGSPNWSDRVEHMLAKVAEDHALRRAFPYEMGAAGAYRPEHDHDEEGPPPGPGGGEDQDDDRASPGEPAAGPAADALDAEFERLPSAMSAAPGVPAWANTALGRQVSALVDALLAAGKRISPPPDDADEQALRGWISSKRALLQGGGR
jgi:hypothetical protein